LINRYLSGVQRRQQAAALQGALRARARHNAQNNAFRDRN
jgi:hypothetical protein